MRRREFLAVAGASGLAASTGCAGLLRTRRASSEPPLPSPRPNAVYFPTHTEGTKMVGTASNGRYRCALSYTFPHRFWLVTGTETERVNPSSDVHAMVTVWDAETGVLLPEASPKVEFTGPNGETTTFSPWQMISQPMGVHHGDNAGLGAEGSYDATVTVAPPSTRRTSGESPPDDPLEFAFDFEFRRSELENLAYNDVPADTEGTRGAVEPKEMRSAQLSQVPPADEFPMPVRGTATAGDADVVVASADERGTMATGAEESYLGVSLRTPYNRFALPATTVDATVRRDGETRYSGPLYGTLDAELGYHYAATVPSLTAADEVTVRVVAPPQVARHEGYETAFLDFDPVTV